MDRNRIAFLLAVMLLAACQGEEAPPPNPLFPIAWAALDSVNAALPEGIRVYHAQDDTLPLRAWYVRIEEASSTIETRVVVSDEADRREAVATFAEADGVCVAVNGGYFNMRVDPATHMGLLYVDGAMVAPATNETVRDTLRYPNARAALGLFADGRADIAWANNLGDTLWARARPPANTPGQPALSLPEPRRWPVRDALGAGPGLIADGEIRITDDEEIFFGTSIPLTHPRTAVGITEAGALLVLVVDGRQAGVSRGVNLIELAAMLWDLGAVEGMNLDGGGSSTLVVRGHLLNRPTGGTYQREVMSALVTYCTPDNEG